MLAWMIVSVFTGRIIDKYRPPQFFNDIHGRELQRGVTARAPSQSVSEAIPKVPQAEKGIFEIPQLPKPESDAPLLKALNARESAA